MNKRRALILRSCKPDMTSFGGFVWPRLGHVAAPDWDPAARCGNGLHGFLWGEGNPLFANWSSRAVWLVAAVDPARVVDLDGTVKFPEAEVLFAGDRGEATRYLLSHGGAGRRIVGLIARCGDRETLTSGCRSIVMGGVYSNLRGGDHATVVGGDNATVVGGAHSIVRGGDCATVTGGDRATVTGGFRSIVTGGYRSTVTGGICSRIMGGDCATVLGGDYSHVVGGDYAIVTGGNCSHVTGGIGALLFLGTGDRVGISGWVDGVNLLPGVAYVDEAGVFTQVDESAPRRREAERWR